MDRLQGSRICGGNTKYKRNASDFYPTPPEPTIALLDFLNIPKDRVVWEPACGEDYMVTEIRNHGYSVVGTDIHGGFDFLEENPDFRFDWIITNPPWSLAEEFIRRSSEYGVPFAMLLKQHFWNAKKRYKLYCECTPKYVLPLTWRPDFCFKMRGSGSPLLDVMWCVWEPNIKNETVKTTFLPLKKPVVIK